MRFSGPNLTAIRAAAPDARFAAMGGSVAVQVTLDQGAQLAIGQLVTGDWFDVLGVPAEAGRLLTAADSEQLGGKPVVVLSYAYWTRVFARDPGVVGRTIAINRVPLTVIGVAQSGFTGLTVGSRIDVWMPVTLQFDLRLFGNASINNADGRKPWLPQDGVQWLSIVGRIAPPATEASVLARLTTTHQDWMRAMLAGILDPDRRKFLGRAWRG
jgi:hypothetical protein